MNRPLLVPALAWVAADAAHFFDHLRQDRDLALEVQSVGIAGYVATAVLLVLIVRRHRLAPLLSTAMGVAIVLGFALVHVVPEWSVLSDAYGDEFPVDGASWGLVAVPAAVGAWLAVAGGRRLRAAGMSAR